MRRFSVWLSAGVFALVMLVSQNSWAAVNAGVLFLRIAPGARAAGMGEAFVALANDATATHYNPAGLGAYPLNNDWEEHSLPGLGVVLDAAAIRNDLPFKDYRGKDLWLLTEQGLMTVKVGRSSGADITSSQVGGTTSTEHASNRIEISTVGVGSIAAAVRRYAPFLSEDRAQELADEVAAAYVGWDITEIEPLLERLRNVTPENYKDRTVLENAVRAFRQSFREARLNEDRTSTVREALEALPETGEAEPGELDRARFALERSVGGSIPTSILVRADAFLPKDAKVRALASDGNRLYIATSNNLFVYGNSRWDLVPAPDESGWRDENINCLSVYSNSRLSVGTDNGLLLRSGAKWIRYTTAEGLPSNRVTHVAMTGQRDGWVNTDAGLARFQGEYFSAFAELTANVGDSIHDMLSRFLDTHDQTVLERAAAKVREVNMVDPSFEPAAGAAIQVPYMLGFRNTVTVLETDSYGRLWVGTDLGTMRYSHDRWTRYGYREIMAPEATTAQVVAEQLLGNRSTPDRASNLAELIIAYNGLDPSGVIAAGRTFYAYRNPAASHVFDIETDGEQVFIATGSGLLEVKSGDWKRYYHQGLERSVVRALSRSGRDMWFVSDDHAVIFKKSHTEITFMYSPWLPEFNLDLYYTFASAVTNFDGIGTLGLTLVYFSYGNIERRDEFGRAGLNFNAFDMAASVSYATRISPNLAGGLTGRLIMSRLADQGAGAEIGSGSATAFSLDAGLLYDTPWKSLRLGAVLSNLGPDISYIDAQQSDPLPRFFSVGFAYKLLDSPSFGWQVVGDLNREIVDLSDSDNELAQNIYNVGTEFIYLDAISGRAGYVYDKDGDIKNLTLGGGFGFENIQIDVSYVPSTGESPLANTVRYSLTARF